MHLKRSRYSAEERYMGVPSPKDKRAACGKATLIILYTNGKFSLMGFFCHRWDCKRCASQRREDIRTTITALHATWYVKSITPAEYVAARKRIVRAGAKYCALGTGDRLHSRHRVVRYQREQRV